MPLPLDLRRKHRSTYPPDGGARSCCSGEAWVGSCNSEHHNSTSDRLETRLDVLRGQAPPSSPVKRIAWVGRAETSHGPQIMIVVGIARSRNAIATCVDTRRASCGVRTSQQLNRHSPKYCLGTGADLQLQKDMFDVRFHRLRRDLKSPCDAFIRAALADHCEDIAFSRSERIADTAAGLRGAITIAGIPLRKQASNKRWKFAAF